MYIHKYYITIVSLFRCTCNNEGFNPFTPTRYPTWLKKIQLAFFKLYGGVKTISKESFSYVT